MRKTRSCSTFPTNGYVCPEPVLVKCSFFSIKWHQKGVFAPCSIDSWIDEPKGMASANSQRYLQQGSKAAGRHHRPGHVYQLAAGPRARATVLSCPSTAGYAHRLHGGFLAVRVAAQGEARGFSSLPVVTTKPPLFCPRALLTHGNANNSHNAPRHKHLSFDILITAGSVRTCPCGLDCPST